MIIPRAQSLRCIERRCEIRNEVVGIFDAD